MKIALITGGSRGIGKATLMELAKEYDVVAFCGRNADTVHATKDEVEKNSETKATMAAYVGDVSDFAFVKSMVDDIIAQFGHIDLLVNNAGISKVGLMMDMTAAEWNEIVSVNLTSVYNTCHEVVPHMVSAHAGKIINVSSVWGLVGASCEVAYSATKGGVNSFTMALAKELAPSNISVNAIAFGAVDTEMNGHLSKEEAKELADEIPFGRMANVEEAAKCIAKISEMPSYFTGEIIKFDGGWI